MFTYPEADYAFGGLFYTEEKWIHPTRNIDSYEIIYVVEGTVHLQEEGQAFTLQKGDVYLLRPHVTHGGWQESSGKTSFYWVHFRTEDVSALQIRPGLVRSTDSYRFAVLLRQILHIANTPAYPSYTLQASLLQLLGELSAAQMAAGRSQAPLLFEISEYVRINAQKRVTVQSVADKFGYNPDYVSALFRQNFHISLKQYISNRQVAAAKELLVTTNQPIKWVAEQMGWADENEFIHFFKYHAGIAPNRFRNLYARTHMNNK